MITINENGVRLTATQRLALARFVHQITDRNLTAAGHDVAWTFELRGTTYGQVWVKVSADIPSLPTGNALRVITWVDNDWFVAIGRRGKLTAAMYPNSLKQFAGQSWCGIHIEAPVKVKPTTTTTESIAAEDCLDSNCGVHEHETVEVES